jgi:hypothetical protein
MSETIQDIDNPRTWTAFRLANESDVQCPDSPESAGARFLDSIRDNVVEAWDYNDQDMSEDAVSDMVAEVADNAPDIYTHQMWSEFVDLCAYSEDPSELGFDGSDMDQGARICLYMIAERCARIVADALVAMKDEDSEDDE